MHRFRIRNKFKTYIITAAFAVIEKHRFHLLLAKKKTVALLALNPIKSCSKLVVIMFNMQFENDFIFIMSLRDFIVTVVREVPTNLEI
jgi:hypothetical protein